MSILIKKSWTDSNVAVLSLKRDFQACFLSPAFAIAIALLKIALTFTSKTSIFLKI